MVHKKFRYKRIKAHFHMERADCIFIFISEVGPIFWSNFTTNKPVNTIGISMGGIYSGTYSRLLNSSTT